MIGRPKPRIADAGKQTRHSGFSALTMPAPGPLVVHPGTRHPLALLTGEGSKNGPRAQCNVHSVTYSIWASSERQLNFYDPRQQTPWLLSQFLSFPRIF